MASFTLDIRFPDGSIQTRTFSAAETRVGRDSGEICLGDPGVSSRHAKLEFNGQSVTFCDLGSTNGSFDSNGQRLTAPLALKLNDEVLLGACSLRLRQLDAVVPESAGAGPRGTMVMSFARPAAGAPRPPFAAPPPSASSSPSWSSSPSSASPKTPASPAGWTPLASQPAHSQPAHSQPAHSQPAHSQPVGQPAAPMPAQPSASAGGWTPAAPTPPVAPPVPVPQPAASSSQQNVAAPVSGSVPSNSPWSVPPGPGSGQAPGQAYSQASPASQPASPWGGQSPAPSPWSAPAAPPSPASAPNEMSPPAGQPWATPAQAPAPAAASAPPWGSPAVAPQGFPTPAASAPPAGFSGQPAAQEQAQPGYGTPAANPWATPSQASPAALSGQAAAAHVGQPGQSWGPAQAPSSAALVPPAGPGGFEIRDEPVADLQAGVRGAMPRLKDLYVAAGLAAVPIGLGTAFISLLAALVSLPFLNVLAAPLGIVNLIVSPFSMAATFIIAYSIHTGRSIAPMQAWKMAFSKGFALWLSVFVIGLVAGIGAIFFIIPGILLGAFAFPALMLEQKKFVDANLRSLELAKSKLGYLIVMGILAVIACGVVIGVPTMILGVVGAIISGALGGALASIFSTLATPALTGIGVYITTGIYLSWRRRENAQALDGDMANFNAWLDAPR